MRQGLMITLDGEEAQAKLISKGRVVVRTPSGKQQVFTQKTIISHHKNGVVRLWTKENKPPTPLDKALFGPQQNELARILEL